MQLFPFRINYFLTDDTNDFEWKLALAALANDQCYLKRGHDS